MQRRSREKSRIDERNCTHIEDLRVAHETISVIIYFSRFCKSYIQTEICNKITKEKEKNTIKNCIEISECDLLRGDRSVDESRRLPKPNKWQSSCYIMRVTIHKIFLYNHYCHSE